MYKKILTAVLRSIAVAMGVIVILFTILGNLKIDTAIIWLALGLTSLAIAELQKVE